MTTESTPSKKTIPVIEIPPLIVDEINRLHAKKSVGFDLAIDALKWHTFKDMKAEDVAIIISEFLSPPSRPAPKPRMAIHAPVKTNDNAPREENPDIPKPAGTQSEFPPPRGFKA